MEDQYEVETEDTENESLMRKAEALAESLLKKRNEAIEGRAASGVERRWREDEDVFNGMDGSNQSSRMIDYATGEAYAKTNSSPKRSIVIVNVVRGKCETAEGRFSDIQLPVDDRNWGLRITPVPELVKGLNNTSPAINKDRQEIPKPDGSMVTIADVAKKEIEEAKTKMEAMETEIDDQLTECNFNAENRKCVQDAVRRGTGILKGPLVVKRLQKAWAAQSDGENTVYTLKTSEQFKPASKRINPWNIFPDPNCEDIKRASYIWETDFILPRELRDLIGIEGYFSEQIEKVLDEEPKRTVVIQSKGHLEVQSDRINKGAAYEKWEYHGDVNRDDLESLGCNCDEFKGTSLSACVVFVNDRPIKVMLNILDTGDLPYDFFQWTDVAGSLWGIGLPRMMIWQQAIITAAWRAMMDNAGDSSGANIVLGYGIEPDDGKWELTGKKIWRALGEIDDVRTAFAQFQVENNQIELQNIIKLALQFIDMETSLPMLFQGEKGELPETLGATNIMVDANNIALRGRVKRWDDQITRPHLTRYYHWNMQYNEKSDIKGDYNVDARGTSVLLVKDQQVKILTELLPVRNDPQFKAIINWEKAIKQMFTAQRLDVLYSDEEIKANQQKSEEEAQVVDPGLQGASDIATIRAESEMQILEAKQAQENEALRMKAEMEIAEIRHKAEQAEKDRQHEIALKQMDYQMKIMELSEKTGISLEQIKSDLARDAAKLNLQERLSLNKAGEAIKPPVEPKGRAPEGESFVK